jgi:glycosyltransferase involved in cell wall biosynthesis
MSAVPRLSIGLPVYNGEGLLSEAIEALLGQSYKDFELIISDNASTDGTAEICRDYEAQDSRVRYIRRPRNVGVIANHNGLVGAARGEFFKWASHDDLYAGDYLQRCVDTLDEHPEAVLAHAWWVLMDESCHPMKFFTHPESTAAPRAPDRFRSMLFNGRADWFYAVYRTSILRKTPLHASYHGGDRTLMAELALHGPLHQIPDWLYFRRDHPNRHITSRQRSAVLDPSRASRLNPAIRLYVEYLWGYVSAIRRAPLPRAEKRECYRHLAVWLLSRAAPAQQFGEDEETTFGTQPVLYFVRRVVSTLVPAQAAQPPTERTRVEDPDIDIAARVPGRKRKDP